jgi:pyruvate/2-oxoglutarate dehydrogenase complex dihydrolipoamide acyltransferase (E2) component
MKLEHTLSAPRAAVVKDLLVGVGDQVRMDQLLAVLTAADPDGADDSGPQDGPGPRGRC